MKEIKKLLYDKRIYLIIFALSFAGFLAYSLYYCNVKKQHTLGGLTFACERVEQRNTRAHFEDVKRNYPDLYEQYSLEEWNSILNMELWVYMFPLGYYLIFDLIFMLFTEFLHLKNDFGQSGFDSRRSIPISVRKQIFFELIMGSLILVLPIVLYLFVGVDDWSLYFKELAPFSNGVLSKLPYKYYYDIGPIDFCIPVIIYLYVSLIYFRQNSKSIFSRIFGVLVSFLLFGTCFFSEVINLLFIGLTLVMVLDLICFSNKDRESGLMYRSVISSVYMFLGSGVVVGISILNLDVTNAISSARPVYLISAILAGTVIFAAGMALEFRLYKKMPLLKKIAD